MKLLIFSPYYPPHIGGLESHADEFNKYLSQKGVDITVFTPRLPEDAPKAEARHSGVKIIRFPAFEIISNYPLPKFWNIKFWNLFFSLFKQKFNIVISRTRFFNTSLLAFIYAKIKRIKWINIEHGSDFVQLSSKMNTFLAKIYDYTFGFLVLKFSDQNISISKAVQKFVNKFDKRESPVIYRGLDLERIDQIEPDHELREKYKDKIIITFAGRLFKWKGVENSIEAIKSLPREIKSRIIFLIIGDGEDFLTLKKLSENENCIQMLGNLPREKAITILKSTDIYLHSAQPGGGLSTSLLEAMYCGCVAIATPNEGADEVIKDGLNGILVPDSNKNEIRAKLIALFNNNSLRITISYNSQKIIKESFEWPVSIGLYLKLFNTILKK